MKDRIKLLVLLSLLIFSGCTSKRYLLVNDTENSHFIIDIIKEYQDKGLVKKKPIIVVDGIPLRYNYELKESKLHFLKKDVESVDLLKNEPAIRIYGEYANDGVILITTNTKDQSQSEEKDTSEKIP